MPEFYNLAIPQAMQHTAVQQNAAQCNAAWHSTRQHCAMPHSWAQCCTLQCSAARHSTRQHCAMPHSWAQCCTPQCSAAWHSTRQHCAMPHSWAQRSTVQTVDLLWHKQQSTSHFLTVQVSVNVTHQSSNCDMYIHTTHYNSSASCHGLRHFLTYTLWATKNISNHNSG